MDRTVLIIVEGGRIQDVFCDSPDMRVLVKNLDDHSVATAGEKMTDQWPARFIAPDVLPSVIDKV